MARPMAFPISSLSEQQSTAYETASAGAPLPKWKETGRFNVAKSCSISGLDCY